jgi:hypothetical protein
MIGGFHIYREWAIDAGVHNSQCQLAMVTKFCTAALNTCGFSVWNLLHVTPCNSEVASTFLENMYIPGLMISKTNFQASRFLCRVFFFLFLYDTVVNL